MDANGLRAAFTRFFEDRGHTVVPSASLIPHDPSVLFTIAGMVPFKPYFLGEEPAPWPRATSIQKCFRTADIEIIGTDTYHCTFFEMLGNFSFGDYFKADANPMAWELLTEVLGHDGDRLWVTVHDDDDEAEQIWIDGVGLRPERVQRMGDEDNFWAMGETRPLAAHDLRDLHGPRRVLRQRRRPEARRQRPLRRDLEPRLHAVRPRRFGRPHRSAAERTSIPPAPASSGTCPSSKVPRFHVRHRPVRARSSRRRPPSSAPGTGRMRRPTSRCVCWPTMGAPSPCWWRTASCPPTRGAATCCAGWCAAPSWPPGAPGSTSRSAPTLVQAATDGAGRGLPALVQAQQDLIVNVVAREEAGFDRTLRAGLSRLEEAFATGTKVLAGDVAFTLHDTHGFPVELTEELARDAGVEVDRAGFDAAMAEQRERAARGEVLPGR